MILIPRRDCAHLIGRSERTIRRWAQQGMIHRRVDFDGRLVYAWHEVQDCEQIMRHHARHR